MTTITVPQRLIDRGDAVSGSRQVAMAALKVSSTSTILWLRANGSATLFYYVVSMPSGRRSLRQRTWKRFTLRLTDKVTP